MTGAVAQTASGDALGLAPPIATFSSTHRVLVPRWMVLVALVVGQGLLARFMSEQPRLAQVHAAAILAVALYAVAKRNTPMLLTAFAYLPGAEIIWRQSHAQVPSSMAPYLYIAFALGAVAVSYPSITRSGRTAILYIGLLVPSCVITLSTTGGGAREMITFALVGPAALVALVLLFSHLQITTDLYRRLLWAIVIGGVGPLSIALTSIEDYIGAGKALEFDTQSNGITSGGFGPVQVSSVLGFTVVAAVLLLVMEHELVPRLLVGAIGLASMTSSLLTFSRGGMLAATIALGGFVVAQTKDRHTRKRATIMVVLLVAAAYFVVFPRLDSFTQGKFNERFSTTRTGRTTLATSDLEIFREHLVFGVGPGMSKFRQISYEVCQLRSDRCDNEGGSHTEFTRMPAEHGLAGVVAIAVLTLLALEAIRRSGASFSVSLTMLLWAIAQMFYANLRVAAVPFAFAFAFIQIRSPDVRAERAADPPRPARAPPSWSSDRVAGPAVAPVTAG